MSQIDGKYRSATAPLVTVIDFLSRTLDENWSSIASFAVNFYSSAYFTKGWYRISL